MRAAVSDEKTNFWFYAKNYGWGWSFPARWQGWLVFAVYAALLFSVRSIIANPEYRIPYIIGVTALLVLIIVWKGERPLRWRWGGD